jgi:hypothetical protein
VRFSEARPKSLTLAYRSSSGQAKNIVRASEAKRGQGSRPAKEASEGGQRRRPAKRAQRRLTCSGGGGGGGFPSGVEVGN